MLKNRSLLTGLGIGLILGSILLQSAYAVRQMEQPALQASPREMAEQLSAAEFKEIAESKGFVLKAEGETLYTQAEVEAAKTKAVEEAQSRWQAEKPANASPAAEETARMRGVYIKPGLDAFTVAARLEEFGIIADSGAFVESLAQQKLNTKIQFGYFEFTPDDTLQDVIEKITAPQ